MVKNATSNEELAPWLINGVEINSDAGEADGVIHLRVPEGREQEMATRLMVHLRGQIPGADLQAMWATAPTYPDARPKMMTPKLEALAPSHDFPAASICETCRIDVQIEQKMCADCLARDKAAGRRAAQDANNALDVERRLLASLKGQPLQLVNGFDDLAELDGEKGNHLAVVALDGNGLGAFFSKLDGAHKQAMSRAVSEVTWATLVDSTKEITNGKDRFLPVIPHVVGGDDVVLSLAADRAWQFVCHFLTVFGAKMAEVAPEGISLPTMSAGLVFTHRKFSYARAVQLAEESLRRAKRDTHGAEAAVAWLDVTEDGETPPPWRRPFRAKEVEQFHQALTELVTVGKSGRQALARQLDNPDAETAQAAAWIWARRNNHCSLKALIRETDPVSVRNLTSVARWWRA